ncbi:uncharacterized protein LOC131673528 [Phymastichus coffea]|uniref:uncharacterized protein LOC131673528 n=1 Tax=Phymastichus coffea TaxID=108790 RepID=UPI00273B555E|nr:uncharacterized protein LOC131673528 [Phymastichus coffea]
MDESRIIDPWIRNHLIPRLVKGESNVEFIIERPSGNYFLSEPFFMNIISSKGEKKILVKIPSQNPEITAVVNYDAIFANEILFYKALARGHSHYPECYLAEEDPVFKNVIVLEDVRPRGYVDSPDKVNVHLDYIVAGLKSIAKFHAHSYVIKEKEPEKFQKCIQSLHDSRFKENPINEKFRNIINERVKRATQKIRARNDNSELTKKMCNILDDAFVNVMIECVRQKEPLCTIIHGDCTINNLLYRWQKKDKEDLQLEAMLIDFGLLMHSSPNIDIVTLLYMTCRREDIRDRARGLVEVYHSSLVECMKELGIWNASKYSFENFWCDYRRCAIFGFVIAAFFRGMMTDFDREHNIVEVKSMSEWHDKDGGEEVSLLLVNMFDDLLAAGMLQDFIEK